VNFELKLLASVRVCALALSLVCVAFPTLTSVLLCDHQNCKGERLQVVEIPRERDIVKQKETPWYSSGSLDRLKGVECNTRPLGRHNVEVDKCCTCRTTG
jgi:hypothetical protein